MLFRRTQTLKNSNIQTLSPSDIFDWKTVPEVDEDELKMWLGATDKVERQFPLAVALQAHDELEQKLLLPGKLDGMALAEIRGGIKALARFAQIYSKSLGAAADGKVEVNVPEDEK